MKLCSELNPGVYATAEIRHLNVMPLTNNALKDTETQAMQNHNVKLFDFGFLCCINSVNVVYNRLWLTAMSEPNQLWLT